MTAHPGRLAMLERAGSTHLKITTDERDRLIRYGAPGHEREHVLATLREVADLRKKGELPKARELIATLLEPPKGDGDA